jgi:tetratricopeptide (TPR) repeat protein
LVIGPWFVVEGEHPVRDGFIFIGLGSGLWALFGGLLTAEEFARGQPTELQLGPAGLAWRKYGERTLTRRSVDELVSSSTETDIIYVRNVPRYRHPLVLTFTDGERLTIHQLRATRLGTSSHHLAHEIRQRYMNSVDRTDAERATAEAWTTTAQNLDAEGEAAAAADAFRRAIASYPDHSRLALHAHVGDLLRSVSNHQSAVSSYRAHLDFAPSDSAAWRGLVAAYTALGREDLANEAAEAAGQSSMRRYPVTS